MLATLKFKRLQIVFFLSSKLAEMSRRFLFEFNLLKSEQLMNTPSNADGLDPETERDLRIFGCELIQNAGILLRLPQTVMATGQVLFQRYFYAKSFVRCDGIELVATACIFLAAKLEESSRRLRDVINVCEHLKQLRNSSETRPLLLDDNYSTLKRQVIKAEHSVLTELGFRVQVQQPHKLILMYLQVLNCAYRKQLTQLSWNYMNDALRTSVFMYHKLETIACACIYLSALNLKIMLPHKPSWFGLYGVSLAQIKDVCVQIMALYRRQRPDWLKIFSILTALRQTYNEVIQ